MRAALDAMGGVLGARLRDFDRLLGGLRPQAALFAAVQCGTVAGRGANMARHTISPRMSNLDRTGRAHPIGEPREIISRSNADLSIQA